MTVSNSADFSLLRFPETYYVHGVVMSIADMFSFFTLEKACGTNVRSFPSFRPYKTRRPKSECSGHVRTFWKKKLSTPQIAEFKQNVRTLPWGLIVNKKMHSSRRTLRATYDNNSHVRSKPHPFPSGAENGRHTAKGSTLRPLPSTTMYNQLFW